MGSTSITLRRYPAAEILLLAVVGGGVDAVTLLGFGALTAAQTGNTILLAVALAQGRLVIGLHSAVSIASYVVGTALAEMIIDARRLTRSGRLAIGWTLLVELIALGSLLVGWLAIGPNPAARTSVLLVALAAVAMGMQSAAVLRLHVGPATTYITGTLTTFTVDVIRWPHLVEPARLESGEIAGQRPWIYGITWVVYFGGAIVTGLLYQVVGERALLLPVIMLVAAVIVAWRGHSINTGSFGQSSALPDGASFRPDA